jgi:hypothetical protein
MTQVEEDCVVRLRLSELLGGLVLHLADAFPSGLNLAPELGLELVDFGHGSPFPDLNPLLPSGSVLDELAFVRVKPGARDAV